MNTRRLYIAICLLLICFFNTEILSNDENIDKTEWVLKSGDDAISTALSYTGFSELSTFVIDSTKPPQLVVLEDDQTPFLHQQINGKPLWKVTISVILEIRVEDKSGGSFQRFDENIREFDIYLDPKTGQLMKMLSGSDLEYPHKPPLASADVAEWMLSYPKEIALGFPTEISDVNFLEALRYVVGNPFSAKEIHVLYIIWTNRGRDPRPVWSIDLRGTPPTILTGGPERTASVPIEERNHMRSIVCAKEAHHLQSSTGPQGGITPEAFLKDSTRKNPK